MRTPVFLYPTAFFLLWLIPAAAAAWFWGIRLRKRVNDLYGTGGNTMTGSRLIFVFQALLIVAAMILSVTALSGPAWDKETRPVKTEGRDVVFLVDVSQSMLARDLNPNRLIQAQTAIQDTIDLLEGDRAALVAFAGSTVILSPLTTDYRFLRRAAGELSIGTADRGGSRIGDALRKTLQLIFPESEVSEGYRDIILITDGEDQDTFPIEAARTVGKKGIRLICIGLGNSDTGTRIPVKDPSGTERYLMYDGKEVWSRLDADSLREMAAVTPGGKYVNVSRGSFDLASIYTDLVKDAEGRKYDSGEYDDYKNEYRLFLFPALLLMTAALFLRRWAR